MGKILAHVTLGCKRIHKPGLKCSAFLQIFMELCGSKVQLKTCTNFINGVASPEIIFLEILVLVYTNYNDFLIFNSFVISYKRRNATAISWKYSTNKKSIK